MTRLATMLLMAVFFVGCASTKGTIASNQISNKVENNEKASTIVLRINRGNSYFNAGQFSEAEKIYKELLAEYNSRDGSFETAVLTDLCMCYLETGERGKFKHCANRLKEASKNVTYLSRETQMVIELSETLGNSEPAQKDWRIDSRLSNSIKETFKEVK